MPAPAARVTYWASDVDWSHGDGPVVDRPGGRSGADLLCRAAWLDRLGGPGRESLATWVGSPPWSGDTTQEGLIGFDLGR